MSVLGNPIIIGSGSTGSLIGKAEKTIDSSTTSVTINNVEFNPTSFLFVYYPSPSGGQNVSLTAKSDVLWFMKDGISPICWRAIATGTSSSNIRAQLRAAGGSSTVSYNSGDKTLTLTIVDQLDTYYFAPGNYTLFYWQ